METSGDPRKEGSAFLCSGWMVVGRLRQRDGSWAEVGGRGGGRQSPLCPPNISTEDLGPSGSGWPGLVFVPGEAWMSVLGPVSVLSSLSVTNPTVPTCCAICGHWEAPVSAVAGHVRAPPSLLFHLILMGRPSQGRKSGHV